MNLPEINLFNMNLLSRNNIIILIIIVIIIISGYFIWKYYFNKPKNNTIMPPTKLEEFKSSESMIDKVDEDYKNTNTDPYFDINIDNQHAGRVVFQLFDEETPLTCTNFRYLCSNGIFDKDKPSYEGVQFHRLIKDFMLQGGDFTNGDGTGGHSLYGENFDDENFNLTHNQPGMLSMANSGPNTNGSQFFITFKKTPWLDNKHVVFGIIKSGFDIIQKIEDLETDENDKPLKSVTIAKCGLLFPEKK
jgi:cyclophilin family peptidyl-prolyl cis-trans isomerase